MALLLAQRRATLRETQMENKSEDWKEFQMVGAMEQQTAPLMGWLMD